MSKGCTSLLRLPLVSGVTFVSGISLPWGRSFISGEFSLRKYYLPFWSDRLLGPFRGVSVSGDLGLF